MRYDDDDDDQPGRKKRHTQQSGPPVGLIVGIVAGVILLVAGGIGAYFALRPKNKPVEKETTQEQVVPGIPSKDLPAALGLRPGWVEFRHPEGLFTVKAPAKPVQLSPPENGSIFNMSNVAFFNKSGYVATGKELSASMDVLLFTEAGLESDRRSDEKLGPTALAVDGTRTAVKWAGRDAVEDRKPSGMLSVRRRLYVGNRLYQFTITGATTGRPTQEELALFFDSFQPQKEQ